MTGKLILGKTKMRIYFFSYKGLGLAIRATHCQASQNGDVWDLVLR